MGAQPAHDTIRITRDSFPLAEVFTIARGSRTEAQVLTVHIDQGETVGRGECVPYARYGETLDSVTEQIESYITSGDSSAMPAGAARNAVDCAIWDAKAKAADKRVWELLGEPAPKPVTSAFTLSLDTPDKMRAAATRNAGRPLLKIKLGTPTTCTDWKLSGKARLMPPS